MKVLGCLAGVGSMLYEALAQGDEILGNVESRAIFYNKPWWSLNFGDRPMYRTVADVPKKVQRAWQDADLAIGHPPCGSHSVLGESKVSKDLHPDERKIRQDRRSSRVGLLPEFTDLIQAFTPKLFALDNLPKILKKVATQEWWETTLPDYHISTAIITNGHYGCVQIRKRLWIFGTRRDVSRTPFQFRHIVKRPPKAPTTMLEALTGLSPIPWENDPAFGHIHRPPNEKPIGGFRSGHGKRNVLTDHQSEVSARYLSQPVKHPWVYETISTNRETIKVGWLRTNPDGYCSVLSGFPSSQHPLTGWPLTPRERARLMGWPDSFKLNAPDDLLDNRGDLWTLTKITGRGVPSEFVRFLLPQLRTFLK